MALHHAEPGEIVDLTNPQQGISQDQSTALVRTDDIEVIRRVLRADQSVPSHELNGDMTLQCLAGEVNISAHGRTQSMTPGRLVYISACEPFSLAAGDDEAVILMTIVRTHESAEASGSHQNRR